MAGAALVFLDLHEVIGLLCPIPQSDSSGSLLGNLKSAPTSHLEINHEYLWNTPHRSQRCVPRSWVRDVPTWSI